METAVQTKFMPGPPDSLRQWQSQSKSRPPNSI